MKVVCVNNDIYPDLQIGAVYKSIPDDTAKMEGLIKILTGFNEQVLFPKELFEPKFESVIMFLEDVERQKRRRA